MALHSVSWMELGNELQAGRVSLARFHTLLTRRLPFLSHIKLNTVTVVSHLGDVIPVPSIFCSTWEDFHHIINGHCKGRFGNRFVARGDYMLIQADNSQVIIPSECASQVESGMVLEMSIVLRDDVLFVLDHDKNKCPRCGHINSGATTRSGWIECRGCPGQFQVAKIDEIERHVASPASENQRTNPRHQIGMEDLHQRNSIQFFRRIHLVAPSRRSSHPVAIRDRQLDEMDAPDSLDVVKMEQDPEQPDVYSQFLDLVNGFKSELWTHYF
ncbi:hypothetical protein PILCRDRAFT_338021 [Piloderma croceum F 1598]|uniref:Ubiquitin-like domain-containing protein n=1 Tax=Piloderma croceum (strain F 1598) TaxID=765440 RepID=A0A0C3FN03_PILCF|nr:hypothetical protein PILCRDRAFT_338021 [Piloderma croceum F 1598]